MSIKGLENSVVFCEANEDGLKVEVAVVATERSYSAVYVQKWFHYKKSSVQEMPMVDISLKIFMQNLDCFSGF